MTKLTTEQMRLRGAYEILISKEKYDISWDVMQYVRKGAMI
jgi:hypothetical protein